MSKSVDAFRTIAEVADDLGVPKHVLRFWEVKFPQIRPMKRGGGRRYYRPEDLELLRGIQALLHAEAYTIKGVQKILREQGVDHVKQAGREPPPAAAGKASAKRRRAAGDGDGRAVPEVRVPVSAPGRSSGDGASPSRGAGAVARGTSGTVSSAMRQRIAAVITELEACRALLGERPAQAAPAAAAEGRARATR